MALDPQVELDEEKLESDVREMCKKIVEYRQTTLPDHLRNISAEEAEIPLVLLLGTEEQQDHCGEKMIQLKETVSRNAANTHILVKRVRECMHKLDSLNRITTIHPAFRITP